MPSKKYPFPKHGLPPYEKRTPYSSQKTRSGGLSDNSLARLARRALEINYTVYFVESSSPVFVDAFGRELETKVVGFDDAGNSGEYYNIWQIENSSLGHGRCLYIRQFNNDLTPIKLQRWEQKMEQLTTQ
jgi:hypothetical protein